uniref:Pleckstrin homology and FYVE domain containing 1 n=1 Tax=Monopterus albus TaxID=43700 RepID=A0A3Q3JFM9_MONAL|nr:pleckstrin homology domain-containing family F member 1-like [Monopterus albus]
MGDEPRFAQENQERIHAVETSFGPLGKSLCKPGRVLIGEGLLRKQSRRGPRPRVFFLFNDMLVYGSIIWNGHWHKSQKIIPLEEIQLEDLEDGVKMKNQWLIRTPRKSFYVSAASQQEKRAWIEHIEDCQSRLLQSAGHRPRSLFAVTWIPDQSSAICMRCTEKFTVTQRRHHCRKCGFVVCGACSKKRAVIGHIHPTKQLRVCTMCFFSLARTEADSKDVTRLRGNSTENTGLDEDEVERSGEEEEAEDQMEDHDPSRWMDLQMDSWPPCVYFNPKYTRAQI